MREFLHNHPTLEKDVVDKFHVIVDRDDWEMAKAFCQNHIKIDRKGTLEQNYHCGVDPLDGTPGKLSAKELWEIAQLFSNPQPVWKPPTLKPWKVTAKLKPEQRFKSEFLCTVRTVESSN
jgi:hypothetical protein